MTNEEIQKAKESFLRMGVAEGSIFSEIMRARYLDYNLFLNPTNAEYGVTIESLYENMKLTSDKFGDYTGNEETYANVYTLAMRINPILPQVLLRRVMIYADLLNLLLARQNNRQKQSCLQERIIICICCLKFFMI